MSLKCCVIVLALIAEDGAAAIDLAAIAHELIPIVMPNLMPEMAEQRAISFAHGNAIPLSGYVVSLCQ